MLRVGIFIALLKTWRDVNGGFYSHSRLRICIAPIYILPCDCYSASLRYRFSCVTGLLYRHDLDSPIYLRILSDSRWILLHEREYYRIPDGFYYMNENVIGFPMDSTTRTRMLSDSRWILLHERESCGMLAKFSYINENISGLPLPSFSLTRIFFLCFLCEKVW